MLLVVMRRPMLVISLLLTQMAIADADAMQGYIDALSYPARIVVKPMNSIVLLDQKISFFCRADGNPIPTVLWKRNGDRISALSRYVVHGQKNGLSTLRIEPVRDADNNTDISCTADNGVGKPVEAKAILSVILPKNLPENFPVIQQHPKLKAVEKNRPAQVVCTVQSPNSSRVLWLRDLLPLDLNDPRYSIATLGNPGSLMIMNSREKDEGKYECVARNGDYVAHSKAAHLYVKVRRVPPHFSIPPNNTYKVGPGGSVDLKCVAVGYPMPKVFWRRGYHETLQDPDNAPVGKNILTLKEVERSENYTCVAVSKLGNIEFLTKVIVKDFPPAPTNLRVSNLTSYSITLEWNPVQVTATEPLKHYTVQYRPKYTDGTDYLESSPTKTTSASITGLEPWQEYEFRVVAENTVGRGPASIPKDVQTSESTPGSAPLNVQARAVSPSSILVQWVPPEKPNGQIENYVVHYTSTRTNPFTAWERKEVQNILMATIHGLEQDTTYFVKVQAKNKKGVGVLSDMATVVTKMGIPGQPTNVKAVPVGPRQVIVSWGQPLHSQKILGYTIQYNNSKDTKVLELQNPSENEFAVDSLKPDTEYTFQVAARSTRGQGTLSRPVNAKTNPSVPSGSPTITELERVGPTSLLVKWEPPSKSLQHGRLKSYRITWTPIFDEDDYIEEEEFVGPATYTVSADKERQYKIDDLDVYTLYRVTVAAGTLKGFGPDSGPMELRTGENVPSAPKNVRVDPMDASTVRVSWEPPQRANGELRGYYVYKEELKNGEPIGDRLQKAMVINTPTQRYATIRDLKPNTEYSFRVNAFNRQGDGEFSRVKKIITTGLPPSAPLNVQFSDFHKDPPLRVRISWDPPDRTYGLPIKYYVVRFKAVDDIQFSAKQTTDTFTQINGLLMGKEYEFLVQAVNDDGHSPNATEKLRTPDGVPQAAPQNIRYDYKDKESKTLIVSWDAPPKDQRNGKIVRYETELKNLDESVQGEPIKQDIIISQSTSYIVDPKMPYSFVVKACTEVGCGPPTDTRTFNLRTQVLIKPPTNVRVQSLSTTSVVVQWDQVDDADGYVVYYVHEQQPKNDKNQWYQRSVDGLESDFTIEKLKSDSPYAFCVSSTKDTRTSECSEITIIDKLVPRFMVKDLRVVDISHNEARLEWSYDGGGPVSYYLNYTGYKVYQDIHLKTKDMNFSGVEDATDQTYYHWKYLRPYTTFTFRVGVEIFEKDGGKTRYWPASVSADTLYYSSPFVPAPAPLNSANEHQFTLSLQPASEEYGLISHYWLVIVPNNKTQRPEAIANNMLDRTHSVDKPYITANLTSDRMKEIITQEDGKFIVGTTVAEGGMENKRLDPAKSYRAFVRAFSRRNPKKVGQSYVPTPPPSVDHYGYQADSVMSPTFHSVKSASAKNRRAGNVWLIGPIIAILIMTVIVGMLIIYWMKRNKKKHLPTRRGSISKVALGPTETSKLLMSDGYPPTISMMPPPPNNAIMNPYEPLMTGITMNGTGMGHIMDPMEMHPMSPPYVPVAQTPGMVAHPPIPITELAGHIERLKANDNMLFFQEYESIETGQQFTWEASNLEMNKPKNRYANVVSYDHSRVKLSFFDGMEGSDYINANYIDGYRKPKAYIATQGPLPETFGDFWRMIWEENSVTIVMLTKLEERTRIKCDMYWPNRGSHTYGQIQVTLTDTLDLAHYTIRTLRLQKRGDTEVRDIRHLQFTAWPDHGVPDHPTPFLMFLKRVKSLNPPEAGPIVTHCSAGIGRTGAFIAIDCMLDRLRFENTVDIYGCVTCLRSQRSYMVQTEDQYVFIHDSVLDAIQSGSTEVPANKLYTHIQALMQIQPLDNASGMELEFRHLAALKMLNAHFGAANLPCNKQKNRLVNILPYDSTRVCLCPLPDVPEGSDYLNASWIDGYRKPRSYIATQGPLPSTTEDLWRLLWEHNSCIIVMLTNLREMGREKCFQYWPGDRSERYGSFVVEPIAEYNMPQYVLREFKMTDTQSGQSRTIRHFQYTEWPEQGSPKSGEMFVEFIGQVHKTKEQFGVDGPITVHCSAGVGRTGVFVTLSIVLERMRYENVVDIFTTVKLLRTQRPNMVQSEDQYHFCYQAALEYLGSFDPYTYAPE